MGPLHRTDHPTWIFHNSVWNEKDFQRYWGPCWSHQCQCTEKAESVALGDGEREGHGGVVASSVAWAEDETR